MSELLVSDEAKFTNFIRMNKATLTSPCMVLKEIELYFKHTRYETAFGDSSAGETSRNILAMGGEFQKHSFISSAFRLPKMHRATRYKHVIKETTIIG